MNHKIPMDQEIKEQMARMEQKLDTIVDSIEQTQKYALVKTVITIVMIVFPIILLLFFLPQIMRNIESQISEIGITL